MIMCHLSADAIIEFKCWLAQTVIWIEERFESVDWVRLESLIDSSWCNWLDWFTIPVAVCYQVDGVMAAKFGSSIGIVLELLLGLGIEWLISINLPLAQ